MDFIAQVSGLAMETEAGEFASVRAGSGHTPPMTKRDAPVPGTKVRGSSTGRPLMAAFDLLGRRGVLRILWELRSGEGQTFRGLQGATELSPATLNTRLRELRAAGLIDAERGYRLTQLAHDLSSALQPLHDWSSTWAKVHARTKAPAERRKAGAA